MFILVLAETLLEDKGGALIADYVYMLSLWETEVEAERVMYWWQLHADDSQAQAVQLVLLNSAVIYASLGKQHQIPSGACGCGSAAWSQVNAKQRRGTALFTPCPALMAEGTVIALGNAVFMGVFG